jgi:phenylglyoxylate dehydrogenase beta subunit
MDDYYENLAKAIAAAKKGMAYLHVFSPCPTGWRFSPSELIEVSRKGVETNIVPLWEYSKDTARLQFTRSVDNPLPVQDYLKLIGKFKHLDAAQIDHIQKSVKRGVERLEKFARVDAFENNQEEAA